MFRVPACGSRPRDFAGSRDKVDRTITGDMLSNEHDAAIVRSTVQLGHELGRCIVAEGVESREALAKGALYE